MKLFNDCGSAAISTNRIADTCGISRGNLNYHFQTKRELIRCILLRIWRESGASWHQDLMLPSFDQLARMVACQTALARHYRFFYRERPELLRADPDLSNRYKAVVRDRLAALETFFLGLQRRHLLHLGARRGALRSIVNGTWIIVENWPNCAELLVREVRGDSVHRAWELIVDLLQPYLIDECSARQPSRLAVVSGNHGRTTDNVTLDG